MSKKVWNKVRGKVSVLKLCNFSPGEIIPQSLQVNFDHQLQKFGFISTTLEAYTFQKNPHANRSRKKRYRDLAIVLFQQIMAVKYAVILATYGNRQIGMYLGDYTYLLPGKPILYQNTLFILHLLSAILSALFYTASEDELSWIKSFAHMQGLVPPVNIGLTESRQVKSGLLPTGHSHSTSGLSVRSCRLEPKRQGCVKLNPLLSLLRSIRKVALRCKLILPLTESACRQVTAACFFTQTLLTSSQYSLINFLLYGVTWTTLYSGLYAYISSHVIIFSFTYFYLACVYLKERLRIVNRKLDEFARDTRWKRAPWRVNWSKLSKIIQECHQVKPTSPTPLIGYFLHYITEAPQRAC